MPTGVLNSLHVIAYMDNLLIGEHLAVARMHMWSTYMYTIGTSERIRNVALLLDHPEWLSWQELCTNTPKPSSKMCTEQSFLKRSDTHYNFDIRLQVL